MNKQSLRTAKTKIDIKDAFWKLYYGKQIEKITVKEIISTAGYNRSTFYEYFKDVYDVLEQIEADILPEPDEMPFLNCVPTDENCSPHLLPMKAFIEGYKKYGKYYSVLLSENGDPSFLFKIKKIVTPKLREMMLSQGAADGVELDMFLEYNISAVSGVINYWFNSKEQVTVDELYRIVGDLIFGKIPR